MTTCPRPLVRRLYQRANPQLTSFQKELKAVWPLVERHIRCG